MKIDDLNKKFIASIKEINNDGDIIKSFGSIVKRRAKKYKNSQFEQLENRGKELEHRVNDFEHSIICSKREINEIEPKLKELKLSEEKERKKIIERGYKKNLAKEIERIKTLPIKFIVPVDIPNKKLPAFIIMTDPLKIEELPEEELKKRGDIKIIKELFNKEIGRFIMIINPYNIEKFKVFNFDFISDDEYDHPCIDSGNVCFGNKSLVFKKIFEDFNFFDCIDLTIDLLISAVPNGPYIQWGTWFDGLEKIKKQEVIKSIKNEFEDNLVHDLYWESNNSPLGYVFASQSTLSSNNSRLNEHSRQDANNILERVSDQLQSRMREYLESINNPSLPTDNDYDMSINNGNITRNNDVTQTQIERGENNGL